jgi:putative toxin-antitoxin system antitoxin component (TIGR02293 family)
MTEVVRRGSERTPTDVARFWEKVEAGEKLGHPYILLLGLEPTDTAHLAEMVEKGFYFRELERLKDNVGLPLSELARLVRITPRTLNRRKKEGRLTAEESDRLLRLARVLGSALKLFEGDVDTARAWLSSPQRALGGAVPWDLSRTDIGAREVENTIGRLEHGVFV